MPKFQYTGRNRQNEAIEGTLEAETEAAAADLLLDRGLVVTSLSEAGGFNIGLFVRSLFNRVSKKDISIFLRQLAILISAAIPLVQAIRILADQTTNSSLREALNAVVDEVEGGTKLSVAFSKFPYIFNSFFVNMIRSGETSGKLDEIMNYLADQQERDYELHNKIQGALSYPIFIVSVMCIAAFVMMYFVLPKMLAMFKELGPGVQLPWTTQALMGATDITRNYWYLIIGGFVGSIVGIRIAGRSEAGRRILDTVKLRIPVFGKLFRYIYIIRFTRSFGTILVGGVTVPMGLRIVKDVIGNSVYENLITRTIKEVEDGNPISSVFMKSKEVPRMVAQMFAVGEQTGRLDDVLLKITDFYVREVNATIETVITLIEPMIMVLLGVGVAIIVAGILLPMYQITASV